LKEYIYEADIANGYRDLVNQIQNFLQKDWTPETIVSTLRAEQDKVYPVLLALQNGEKPGTIVARHTKLAVARIFGVHLSVEPSTYTDD
jgi:hypothetical protein